MARRRWIDPSFWDDEDIGDLTFRERLFFIGCWSNADDEGRIRGNPAHLRAEIFQYDDLSLEEILEIRDRVLAMMGRSLFLYQKNGRDYLAFDEEHWKRYQNPNHPKPSTLPAPPQREDRGPQEARKNPDRAPQEEGQKASNVGRVGLDRVGKDREGKAAKPSRKRDPRLDHPAISGYRTIARLTMQIALRDDWIACAKELGTDVLLGFVKEWVGRGYRPDNVLGMMEYARRGGDGGTRTDRRHIDPEELKQYEGTWQS